MTSWIGKGGFISESFSLCRKNFEITRTFFGNRMLFKIGPRGFSEQINYKNSNWKRLLGFRNLQENRNFSHKYYDVGGNR